MSQEKDLFQTEEEKDLFSQSKPASAAHKDLWLFLIILDAVLLCVFGFCLYKSLYSRLLPAAADLQQAIVVEEVETGVAEQIEPALPPQAKPEPAVQAPAQPEPETKPAEPQPPAEPAPVAQPEADKTPAAEETKQSVFVHNTGGRYRQVTFRYYGEANSVAVVSGFTMAKPRAMKKVGDYWETTLSIAPGTYKYLLVVDGKQMTDPYALEQDGRSVLTVK